MIRLNRLLLQKISNKWVLIVTFYIVLFVGAFTFALSNPYQTISEPPVISARLNDIQTQLTNLQGEIKKPAEKIDLSSINQDFNKLTSLIEQLKSKDDGKLNQLMIENRTELTNKLDAIHLVMNSLDQKQHPIKYLPVTGLPFRVISIDSIQQVSVASVAYNYKTIPLEKSDALAGWTVMKIDFGKQRLEFENGNKERVLVTLDMTQEEQHG